MKKKHRPSIPGILGAVLILAGLMRLYSGPDISQYVFSPRNIRVSEALLQAETEQAGADGAIALHGSTAGIAVETEKKSQSGVTLYQVSGDWHSVYAQSAVSGRLLTKGDVEGKNQVILLDEQTAFQLFGEEEAVGQQVRIGTSVFETVGVIRHGRRIGEEDAFAAWIPLGADGAPGCDVMVFSAGGSGLNTMHTTFEKTARDLFGDGQTFHLRKEQSRGTILLRMMILIIGLRLTAVWFRFAKKKSGGWLRQIREKHAVSYPKQMIFYTVGRVSGITLLFAAGIGFGALLVGMMGSVMLEFPEWIPRVLVDPDAIRETFWSLTVSSAKPIQWQTPEMAEIRFWSGMIRWGTVLFLLDRWRPERK